MASLDFRSATREDIDNLVAIDSVAVHEAKRRTNIQQWVQGGFCYIAIMNTNIVGYGVLHHHFFDFGFVEMLMVTPSMRRAGIGRSLLRYLAGQCQTSKLWTSTNQSNEIMQALLVSEGFSRSGIIENLDPGDPELIFYKVLQKASGIHS